MKRIAPKRMDAWYDLSVGKREKIPPFCRCAEGSFQHGALWSLASAYRIYMDPEVDLGCAKQPALAIWGQADRSHPETNAERSKFLADNVQYVSLEGVGHFPELEVPTKIHELIKDFLSGGTP
ncbi:MAG: hypothetical protein AAFR21_12690 [Pseudomonadota bacterium]